MHHNNPKGKMRLTTIWRTTQIRWMRAYLKVRIRNRMKFWWLKTRTTINEQTKLRQRVDRDLKAVHDNVEAWLRTVANIDEYMTIRGRKGIPICSPTPLMVSSIEACNAYHGPIPIVDLMIQRLQWTPRTI